jgi:hypothetical protein
LSTSIEGVIARPHIYVKLGLGRPNGHNFLAITEDLSLWIPSGMNIRLSHGGELNNVDKNDLAIANDLNEIRATRGPARCGALSSLAPKNQLALGELRGFASFLQTVLLPFLTTGITGEIAFYLQRLAILRGQLTQSPSYSQTDGICLAG